MSGFFDAFTGLWPIFRTLGGSGLLVIVLGFLIVYGPGGLKTKIVLGLVIAFIVAGNAGYILGVKHDNARWEKIWDNAEKAAVVRGSAAAARAGIAVDRGVRDPQDVDE